MVFKRTSFINKCVAISLIKLFRPVPATFVCSNSHSPKLPAPEATAIECTCFLYVGCGSMKLSSLLWPTTSPDPKFTVPLTQLIQNDWNTPGSRIPGVSAWITRSPFGDLLFRIDNVFPWAPIVISYEGAFRLLGTLNRASMASLEDLTLNLTSWTSIVDLWSVQKLCGVAHSLNSPKTKITLSCCKKSFGTR